MILYKLFLAYFNKFHGETYKKNSKKLIQDTKTSHFNDKNVLMKTKKNRKQLSKKLCKIGKFFEKKYVKNKKRHPKIYVKIGKKILKKYEKHYDI